MTIAISYQQESQIDEGNRQVGCAMRTLPFSQNSQGRLY